MLHIGSGEKFLNSLSQEEISELSENKDSESLRYFDFGDLYSSNYTWWIIYENKTIKGVVKTQVSGLSTKELSFSAINYISIHQNFQGQGLAKQLLKLVFEFYQGQNLLGTRYSEQGRNLKPLLHKLAREHGVYFVDKELLNILSELDSFPKTCDELFKFYEACFNL